MRSLIRLFISGFKGAANPHTKVSYLHRIILNDALDVGTMTVYIIAFLFAFYGLYHFIQNIIIRIKVGCNASGGKLCLVPHPGDEGLEGKIRCIFLEEIFERLGTDGCLYIKLEENDTNKTLVEKLTEEYPRLVLMDGTDWGRMDLEG